jgi:hypothetical protein
MIVFNATHSASASGEIAVRWTQHVRHVASAGAETFAHAEVVPEYLTRRCRHVLWAIEEMFNDVYGQRFESFVCFTAALYFRRQVGRVELDDEAPDVGDLGWQR